MKLLIHRQETGEGEESAWGSESGRWRKKEERGFVGRGEGDERGKGEEAKKVCVRERVSNASHLIK